jgi:hypothetical protein
MSCSVVDHQARGRPESNRSSVWHSDRNRERNKWQHAGSRKLPKVVFGWRVYLVGMQIPQTQYRFFFDKQYRFVDMRGRGHEIPLLSSPSPSPLFSPFLLHVLFIFHFSYALDTTICYFSESYDIALLSFTNAWAFAWRYVATSCLTVVKTMVLPTDNHLVHNHKSNCHVVGSIS